MGWDSGKGTRDIVDLVLEASRMSKTLSNGTLGLRFMQNAQRAKQLKEVEHQRAEVADEGKWEISRAVQDAWGIGKTEAQ